MKITRRNFLQMLGITGVAAGGNLPGLGNP